MFRISAMILTLVLAWSGMALAQGILDSIFGSGGLGIWGGGDSSQFNAQQYYGSPPPELGQQGYPQQMPGQQPGMQYGYPQAQQPQGYGYPPAQPAPYGSQPGVNAEWYYPPPQEQAAPTGPPPVRYNPPAAQAAPIPQAQVGPPAPYPPGQAPAPLRPGQYSPSQGPGDVEDLPAGAVRVTTTTPDGTTVQFYPPEGQPQVGDPRLQQQQRRPRAQGTAKPRQKQPREQTTGQAPAGSDMSVVMPKPVEIPQGQDPRSGWAPR